MAKLNHRIADLIRAVGGVPQHLTAAVIVAGGSSTRMGGNVSKQMLPICGIPVVARTLMAFQASDCISEIVVAAKAEEIPLYDEIRSRYGIGKLRAVVPGGETRQESVLLGVESISEKARYVAISDAARCLILPEQIDSVCYAAYASDAAIAACPAVDTVKEVKKKGFLETPDRKNLWLASTPQVFLANLYRAAAYTARDEKFVGTDDASLVEHIRHTVTPVDVGHLNFKITDPDDLILAEAVTRARETGKARDGT